MSDFNTSQIRGADVNSLLRMYDQARAASNTPLLKHERVRVDRALERIVKELHKQHVAVS